MHRFLSLLLILVLLAGCAAQAPETVPPETLPVEGTEPAAAFPEPVEDSRGVFRYPLPEDVTGFLPMGGNLLFFRDRGTTLLTLVDPVSGQIKAEYDTGMVLTTGNATVQLHSNGLSFFHGHVGETVVLDSALQEVRRIPAPEDLTGMPLLSPDGGTLYHCTPTAVRAWDLATGICRVLREASYPVQGLSGLLLEGTVLQLSITEADSTLGTLFLSCDTGQLLESQEGNVLPQTIGQRYFLEQRKGNQNTLLFGTAGEAPMVLTPWFGVDTCFFLGRQVLTAFLDPNGLELHLYSLDSGLRTASFLGLSADTVLLDAARSEEGKIWLLCRQPEGTMLFRWDPEETEVKDTICYISPRYTRQEPDLDALAACSLYAKELSSRHGVEILVYTDAVALEPWDYTLEYEYDAAALYRELELLDRRLSSYPPGFLQTLAAKFDGIKIGIVRSIRGTPGSGSVDVANGIQFWDGYTAWILLAAGHDTEQALYHELCHLIDTVVLTESTAYDRWESCNPPQFRYANSHNHTMKAQDWRQAGWETFLDDYSLSYAKEDRARIMEYAMTEGHAEAFQSPYLQAKLELLCTGIREAFGMEDAPEAFSWERYLQVPLAAAP